MKDKLIYIINIISCVLLVVCFFRIGGLEQEIASLKNNQNNYYNMVQSSINSISSNIRYEMEQAADLVSDSGWEISNLDIDGTKAEIYCFIIPKEYNPDVTQTTIICNDIEYPMTLENGKYVANIEIPLFYETVVNGVQFDDNGTIRTQNLDWYISPKEHAMPQVYAHTGGSVSSANNSKVAVRSYDQYINVDVYYPTLDNKIVSAEVVAETDYKESYRKTVELRDVFDNGDEYSDNFDIEFTEKFEVPLNSNFRLYIECIDSKGLRYRNLLEDITIATNGEPIENNYEFYGAEADIYTADGKPLFLKEQSDN